MTERDRYEFNNSQACSSWVAWALTWAFLISAVVGIIAVGCDR